MLKPSDAQHIELSLSADSQEQAVIQGGQWLNIQKHPEKLRLLHPVHYDYFDTLRLKLGWEGGSQSCF